jgi:hypothetical protein
MPDLDTVLAWRGKTVIDRDGEKAGTLGALYLDEEDRPAYAGVQTGLPAPGVAGAARRRPRPRP